MRKAGLHRHAFMILDLFKENWAIEVSNSALPHSTTKALKLSISVCFDVLSSECFGLIVIDRISTQASKIQIFDLN